MKAVNDYIAKHKQWTEQLKLLRDIAQQSGADVAIKWGVPTYSVNGKNVFGLGAFKSYCGIWFFNGVLLKDKGQKLLNAQEEKTKAMRQWRFQTVQEIQADKQLILDYMLEAIQNQKEGKEFKHKPKPLTIPPQLQEALNADSELKKAFSTLSKSCKKEYADHISEAKQESTKQRRLTKSSLSFLHKKGYTINTNRFINVFQ